MLVRDLVITWQMENLSSDLASALIINGRPKMNSKGPTDADSLDPTLLLTIC